MRASINALDITAMHHKCVGDVLLRHVSPKLRAAAARDAAIFCATCPALGKRAMHVGAAPMAVQAFLKNSLLPPSGLEAELQKANASLHRLTQLREEEARRIGEALHREASQLLASVYLALGEFAHGLDPQQSARLVRVRELLDKIDGELRRLSHELCPPVFYKRGLTAALNSLAQGVAARTGIPVEVQSNAKRRLPALVEVSVYRIVQEAINNAVKHARPQHVWVCVQRGKCELTCTVRDDGVGFDTRRLGRKTGKRGLGITGIEDRVNALGGRLSFSSSAGAGASVLVNIPLRPELHSNRGGNTEDGAARATNEHSAGRRPPDGARGTAGTP